MGLEYKIVPSERKMLDKVTCDKCGVEIAKEQEGGWNEFGEPYSKFHEPCFRDFFLVNNSWGYHSRKDLEHHQAVLCEDCYDVVFKDVAINVSGYGF